MALAVVEAGGCVECVVSRMTAARLLICCHSIRRSSPSFASRSSQVTTDMQRHLVSLPHTHTRARARARALSSYSYVKLSQQLKTSVGVAAGDNDACVPYIGSQAWTSELAGNNGASHFALCLSLLIPH